jgi:hypothetical protein
LVSALSSIPVGDTPESAALEALALRVAMLEAQLAGADTTPSTLSAAQIEQRREAGRRSAR